jgi:hypothetical protein
MAKVVIHEHEDGVAVIVPAPGVNINHVIINDVPKNVGYKVIDDSELPESRLFREAWDMNCGIDMDKAKHIWMNKIRVARDSRLKELDVCWMKAMERGEDKKAAAIAGKKKRLRDITNRKDIDDCETVTDLQAYWPQILER